MTIDGQSTPAAATAAEGRRPRRLKTLLLIVAGFLVAIGAVAGGALLFLYDRATAIDRSTPRVSAREFLDATLVLKDPERTSLFVCSDWSADQAMAAVGGPTSSEVTPTWGAVDVSVAGNSATVEARITFKFPDSRRQVETWTLQLVNEDGWRVCGLDKQSSLDP